MFICTDAGRLLEGLGCDLLASLAAAPAVLKHARELRARLKVSGARALQERGCASKPYHSSRLHWRSDDCICPTAAMLSLRPFNKIRRPWPHVPRARLGRWRCWPWAAAAPATGAPQKQLRLCRICSRDCLF